jgi:DNA-binding NarL/FixJ family response regulator
VLIAETSPVVRAGLRSFLDEAGIEVVGEAASASEATVSVAVLAPDVVLLGSGLPDAIVDLGGIRAASPGTAVVVLANSLVREHMLGAIEGGADGYLLRDQDRTEVVAGVRAGRSPSPRHRAPAGGAPPRGRAAQRRAPAHPARA